MVKKPNQTEALRIILNQGRKYTLEQLVAMVSKKTGRAVKAASLTVCLSHLRASGENVVTYRGNKTRDGLARYIIE